MAVEVDGVTVPLMMQRQSLGADLAVAPSRRALAPASSQPILSADAGEQLLEVAVVDDLTGGESLTGLEQVAHPELERIDAHGLGHHVHLASRTPTPPG